MRTLIQLALAVSVSGASLVGCGSLPLSPSKGQNDMQPSVGTPATGSYRVLHRFGHANPPNDFGGANPGGGLLDVDGTLYGTTENGGHGHGLVYSISRTGAKKVLYRFRGHKYGDGGSPSDDLIAVNGTLYGTTFRGGSGSCDGGTVYSLSTTGTEKVLHSFCAGEADPTGGVIDVNGTLYGTFQDELTGGGVYSLSTSGAYNLLYAFRSVGDGWAPVGRLLNVNGKLYGTTTYGGTYCPAGSAGCGTVYSVTTSGTEKVLYRFKGGSDGWFPTSGLINVKGTLYGTTLIGGNSGCLFGRQGCGTVYSLSTKGREKVLYRFDGSDGGNPQASLLEMNGVLYGTTAYGGSHDAGTVFSFSASGGEQVLHSFGTSGDGAFPIADLIEVNGALYGTTLRGGLSSCVQSGLSGCGTVFALTP